MNDDNGSKIDDKSRQMTQTFTHMCKSTKFSSHSRVEWLKMYDAWNVFWNNVNMESNQSTEYGLGSKWRLLYTEQ